MAGRYIHVFEISFISHILHNTLHMLSIIEFSFLFALCIIIDSYSTIIETSPEKQKSSSLRQEQTKESNIVYYDPNWDIKLMSIYTTALYGSTL